MMSARETGTPDLANAISDALCTGWRDSETILTEMFGLPVSFGRAELSPSDRLDAHADPLIVGMSFSGPSRGLSLLALPRACSLKLVAALLGEDDVHSDEVVSLVAATVLELGNVVLNSVLAEVGRRTAAPLDFDLPTLLGVAEVDEYLCRSEHRAVLAGQAVVGTGAPASLQIGLALAAAADTPAHATRRPAAEGDPHG